MSYRIAVRALCEFVAKRGDLDLRFTPSPTALEGMEGHAKVVARRNEDYIAELGLEGEFEDLLVRGRADGFDPARRRLEEIKTHRGPLERQPENHRDLHWAQVKIYGFLACEHFGYTQIELSLVYFDVDRERETPIRKTFSLQALKAFFDQTCRAFLAWARQEEAHRIARTKALATLVFPRTDFRPGQRELAEMVYKAARLERTLLLQAPTGIGKTLGTLFPMLKAMPASRLDSLFFLTAKTTGRQLAIDAVVQINERSSDSDAIALRAVELIAREKSCEHPELACHGDSCPLAKGFYDRLPLARSKAIQRIASEKIPLDAPRLREIALSESICPYYFGQEMARWADIVIGDYNHYFGLSGMLYALSQQQGWRVGLLMDEAHNMIERGRMMFSTELSESSIRHVARQAPKGLGRTIQRVAHVFAEQRRNLDELENIPLSAGHTQDKDSGILREFPSTLISELIRMTARIGERLSDQPEQPLDAAMMGLYLDALHVLRVFELYDPRYFQCEYERSTARYGNLVLRLRNSVPGPWLAPRFESASCSILFSATLTPARYYQDVLGLPSNTVWHDIASPFVADQLSVSIVSRVSTRYRDRSASIRPIAEQIRNGYLARKGNYLAFFSSFDYLGQVSSLLAEMAPEIPQWQQQRRMDEADRAAFVQRFTHESEGVGFAVLGGVFGEGIDLPGERLIGAFVATLGLPQFNPFNEALRQRLNALYGNDRGYLYAYLYPGMTKVIQAAGRVIRSEHDRGCLWLIDDRFALKEVQALLPAWWDLAVDR